MATLWGLPLSFHTVESGRADAQSFSVKVADDLF
jgi:hypothetical protein